MTTRRIGAVAASLAATALLAACGSAPVPVTPLPAEGHWQPGLVGLPQYGPSGLGPTAPVTGSTPAPTTAPTAPADPTLTDPVQQALASVGLQPSDVATGIIIEPITRGTEVDGQVTLDFCGADYPSEGLRVARRQVSAFDASGAAAGLSSEAVQYRDDAAAQQAITELIAARKACPQGSAVLVNGEPTTYTFHSAPGPSSVPLVDAADRVVVHLTAERGGSSTRAVLIYQRVGSLVVGLYGAATGSEPFDQSSLDRVFVLAGNIADRMRAATKSA